MKILAIRGENIASLAQKFAVEFDGDLLKQQGLIAISGKTGSGKSSLLDAMCLALYEQVPRFGSAGRSVEVGSESEQQKLKANDVRHLVSRGKSEAWVEVEILSNDQQRYLVRWQARRARGHVNGRWQGSTRELIDIGSQAVFSENKREFQTRVDALVGLDYEQFRRAVVLAQGDFAAFLQAPEDQRSALLERMTGTQLYSNISQQVYQNAREQKQRVEGLEEQMGRISQLSDEERKQLQVDLSALTSSLERFELASKAQLALEQTQQQYQNIELERDALAKQKETLEAAELEIQAIQKQLSHLRAVEPQRGLYQSLQRFESELTSLAQQLSEQQQMLKHSEYEHQQAQENAKACQLVLEQSQQKQLLREPEIERAQRLDHELTSIRTQSDSLEQQQVALSDEIVVVKHSHKRLLEQSNGIADSLVTAKNWLSEHQHLHHLQHQNSVIERNLQVYLDQKEQQSQLTKQSTAHDQHLLACRHEISQSRAQLQQYQSLDAQLSQQLLSLTHVQSEDVLAKYQQVNAQVDQQAILCRFIEQALQLGEYTEQAQIHQEQLQGLQIACQQRQQHLVETAQRLEIECQESLRAYQSAQSVVNLDQLRQKLVADEACPLCGSEDHPYAEHSPEVIGIFHELEQRHLQLQEQLRTTELERVKQDSEVLQLGTQLAELSSKLLEWRQQNQGLTKQALAQGFHLPESFNELLEFNQHQQQLLLELGASQSGLAQQLNDAQAQSLKRQQLQERYNESQQHLQKLQHQLFAHEQELEHHLSQLQQLQKQQTEALRNLQHQGQQLALLLGDLPWQQWLEQLGPRRCALQIINLIGQYQQVLEQQRNYEEQQNQVHQKIALEEQSLEKLNEQLSHLQQQLVNLNQQALHLKNERKGLLEGLAVNQWREQEATALGQLREQADHSQQQQNTLAKQSLVAQTHIEQLTQQQKQRNVEYQQAQEQWKQALETLELDEQQVRQLLGLDQNKRQQWEQQNQNHQQQIAINTSQSSELELRAKRIDSQLRDAKAKLDGHLVKLKLESGDALSEQRASLQEQAYQLRAQIEQDKQSQQQSGELGKALIQQQQRLELLETLNQLIGSASGAKFRVFAQQLTLENLLFEANAQLQSLAPRYQLQRVPEAALSLQVIDRDMGDEIRSISSLSGGETFLVSLALALALASVSADSIEIRSLFIDEGFGTLDPESLDMVLACLDNLQASGRQVTVISHVQAMVERIPARVLLQPLGAGRSEINIEIA